MKKIFILSVAVLGFYVSNAQLYLPKGTSSISQGGQGTTSKRVGVNTALPEATLHIYESSNPTLLIANVTSGSSGYRLQLGVATSANNFVKGSRVGDAVIRTLGGNNSTILAIPNNSAGTTRFIGIADDANGLWAKFCNNKTLYVNGTIKVVSEKWADDVFDADYKAPTIAEIESYIVANKHLPGVPSAVDVAENGINVAEMSATLLRKIEELTLLVIEQNKTIEQLKQQVEK